MSQSHWPFAARHDEHDAPPEGGMSAPRSRPTERPSIHDLGGEIQFILSTAQLTRVLYGMVAAFVAIQVVILVWRLGFHGQGLTQLTAFFTLDAENNIPTFFSAALLLLSSLLCAVAGRIDAGHEAGLQRYWYLLAGVFSFLAVDEACEVHEFINRLIHSVWLNRGMMQWPWVLPYLVLAAVVGFTCIPFLRQLPADITRRCFVAGVVYVTGAAGFDMIEGAVSSVVRSGAESLRPLFLCLPVIEEPLEMIGVILFAAAVLRYIEGRSGVLRVRVTR
jgi:hypothetical protein